MSQVPAQGKAGLRRSLARQPRTVLVAVLRRRSTDLLALYLLLDGADADSFHAPYYSSLPSHTTNFPMCWSERELACLEGSEVVGQVRANNRSMKSTFDTLLRAERDMLRGCDPGSDQARRPRHWHGIAEPNGSGQTAEECDEQ